MSQLRHAAVRALENLAHVRSREMPADELVRPALVFAPHQDDETLGCGGVIALKRQRSVPVDVVYLTDGRTSHRNYMPADELVARRRDEACAACVALGVSPDSVTFLGFPDGELNRHRAAAIDAVGELLSTRTNRQVYVPYRRDNIPDHLETRRVVLSALHCARVSTATVWEYPVWFWSNWPWVAPSATSLRRLPRIARQSCAAAWGRAWDLTEFVDIRSVLSVKGNALLQHRTQTVRPPQHPDWPILADVAGGEWLQRFFTAREFFFRQEFRTRRGRAT